MEILTKLSDIYPELSKGKKKIARYILDNKEEAGFLAASELAVNAGVSESAVVRFAAELGFAGYKSMQNEIQNIIRNKLSFVDRFNSNLELGENKEYVGVIENTFKNINDTFNKISTELLEEVRDEILRARHIGVAGVRGSTAPAAVLQIYLNEILDNTILLNSGMADSFDRIKSWDERDLIIGNGFLFTKAHTGEIMKYAKSKGCRTIALTDSVTTAIGQLADIPILIKTDGVFPSFAACMVVIDVILSYVVQRIKDEPEYLKNIEETEIIIKEWLTSSDGVIE